MHVVVSVTVNTVEMCLKAFINLLLLLYIQPGADRAAYLETFRDACTHQGFLEGQNGYGVY